MTEAPTGRLAGVRRGLADDLRVVLPAWIVARVLVGLGWLVAVAVARRERPGGTTVQLEQGLLAWDGAWYEAIAARGYAGVEQLVGSAEGIRFFPLYPLAGRALAPLLGGRHGLALLVVANVAAVAAGVVVRRLVLDEGRGAAQARRAVWVLMLFPPAFVLVWGYSESLFLVGAAGLLWSCRHRWWWLAAAFGTVAGATRPLGVLMALPAAMEAWAWWRSAPATTRRRTTAVLSPAAAVVGPVLGTAAYLAWVGATTGDALSPFTVQGDFRGDAVDPLTRLARGVGDLLGPERWGDGLHLPFAAAFVVLAVLAFRCWPPSFAVLGAVMLLASLSADNLNSLERYGLNAFPLLLTLAVLASTRWRERVVFGLSAAGLVGMTALAWLGAYVP